MLLFVVVYCRLSSRPSSWLQHSDLLRSLLIEPLLGDASAGLLLCSAFLWFSLLCRVLVPLLQFFAFVVVALLCVLLFAWLYRVLVKPSILTCLLRRDDGIVCSSLWYFMVLSIQIDIETENASHRHRCSMQFAFKNLLLLLVLLLLLMVLLLLLLTN